MNFSIPNPLGSGVDSLGDIFRFLSGRLLDIILPIAAVLYIYAGVLLLTGGTNAGNVKKAKDVLWYTTIGLVIILIGGGFVDLIQSILSAGTGGR